MANYLYGYYAVHRSALGYLAYAGDEEGKAAFDLFDKRRGYDVEKTKGSQMGWSFVP